MYYLKLIKTIKEEYILIMIKIGTRGSELALWQANHVADLIGRDKIEIVVIKTQGDRIQNVSFDKMEGKGFFTKEIEEALLNKRVDLAVHSMKDLPTENVQGLKIAVVTKREDSSDVLLVRKECYNKNNFMSLFDGAEVGTSSLRRAAQLKNAMNSLKIVPLRGNLNTRINKLKEKKYDAIVVAKAGLKRLNIDLQSFHDFTLPFSFFLPAPAQGALALQIREEENDIYMQIKDLNHKESATTIMAERSFLKYFGGGCHIPLGAFSFINHGKIHLTGVIASVDGKRLIRKTIIGDDPQKLGEELAVLFKKEGADKLL